MNEQAWGNCYLHANSLHSEGNNKSSPEMFSLAPELIVSIHSITAVPYKD